MGENLKGKHAYHHAFLRISETYVQDLLRKHYKDTTDEIHRGFRAFTIMSRNITGIFTVLYVVIAIFAWQWPVFSPLFSLVSAVLFAIYLWCWDAKRWLGNPAKWQSRCTAPILLGS